MTDKAMKAGEAYDIRGGVYWYVGKDPTSPTAHVFACGDYNYESWEKSLPLAVRVPEKDKLLEQPRAEELEYDENHKVVDVEALKMVIDPNKRGYPEREMAWNDCLDHLQAQGYLTSPQKWQPISTAPKYKDVLLVTDCGTIVTGRKRDSGYELIGTGWPMGSKHLPTHWIPLPKPPQDTGGE